MKSAMTQPVDACLRLADALADAAEDYRAIIPQFHAHNRRKMKARVSTIDDVIAELRQLAPALQAAMQGWLPIETAPKDGTYVLLYDEADTANPYMHARWNRGAWWGRSTLSGRSSVWHEATHWMPLPTPPTAAEPGEA